MCLIKSIINKFINQRLALIPKIANLNPFEPTHDPSAVSRWRGSYINSIITSGRNEKKLQLIVPWLKTAESVHVVEGWSYHTHGCDYFVGGYSQSKRPNEPQSIVGIIGGIISRPFKYISAKCLVLIHYKFSEMHVKS